MIGKLDQRVRLMSYTEINPQEDGGGLSVEHNHNQSIWAEVQTLSVNAKFQNFVQNILASHQVTIRRNPEVRIGCKLIWQGKTLIVRSEGASSKEYQRFTCEEVADA